MNEKNYGRRLGRKLEGYRLGALKRSENKKAAALKGRKDKVNHRNFVEPIRNLDDYHKLIMLLKADNKLREALLIQVMFLMHLRVSDALQLRFYHFIRDDGTLHDVLKVVEKKTGKVLRVKMFDSIGKLILDYYVRYANGDSSYFIFRSYARNKISRNKPWLRGYVWSFVKEYAKKAGIKENLGTHTFRKTWAYHAFNSGLLPLEQIMNELGHSTIKYTLNYVGIDDDVRKKQYEDMSELVNQSLAEMSFENLPKGAENYRRYVKKSSKKRKNKNIAKNQ